MGTLSSYKPAQTGYSRVFLIKGRSRGDHSPDYKSSLKATGITQGFGDVTRIEIPDENNYGKFIEAGSIKGKAERPTTSLVGRYASAIKSELMEIARTSQCCDVQIHFGECTDPSLFNSFSKAIVMKDVTVSNFTTEDLGALSSDEQNPVNETADISMSDFYEVLPLSFATKAGDIITKEMVGVFATNKADCESGCADVATKIFATSIAAGGSPSTPPDVIFTLDGGTTWKAYDVDSSQAAENTTGIDLIGDYVVVLTNTAMAMHIASYSDFLSAGAPSFTKITTGFVAGGGPNDIFSLGRRAFIVGDSGYVYYTTNPADGVTVLSPGDVTISKLNAVHALSDQYVLVGGNDGVVMYATAQDNFQRTSSSPCGVGVNVTSVRMIDKNVWWIGLSSGKLYYTTNGGDSWTQKSLPGTTPSAITDVNFFDETVGYVTATVSSHGRMYQTYDGGSSWNVLPISGTMPISDKFNCIATSPIDPNFVVTVGLADDGTDGILVIGED